MGMEKDIINLYRKAATEMPEDVVNAIKKAKNTENSPTGKDILAKIIDNIELAEAEAKMIKRRLVVMEKAMDQEPKTLGWKMRARVGTRMRWYEEVEEVQRT